VTLGFAGNPREAHLAQRACDHLERATHSLAQTTRRELGDRAIGLELAAVRHLADEHDHELVAGCETAQRLDERSTVSDLERCGHDHDAWTLGFEQLDRVVAAVARRDVDHALR